MACSSYVYIIEHLKCMHGRLQIGIGKQTKDSYIIYQRCTTVCGFAVVMIINDYITEHLKNWLK